MVRAFVRENGRVARSAGFVVGWAVVMVLVAVITSRPAGAVMASVRPDPADGSLRREAHAAGYLAYAMVFASMVWGALTAVGTVRNSVRRQTLAATHMVLSVMAIAFTCVHAMSHLFKHTAALRVWQLVVPFSTELHVTIGVIGFELLVAAALSVLVQRRLSYHRWHALHRFAYPAFVLVVVHVLASAHHLSDGIVITAMAVTAGVVVVFAIVSLFPAKPAQLGGELS